MRALEIGDTFIKSEITNTLIISDSSIVILFIGIEYWRLNSDPTDVLLIISPT